MQYGKENKRHTYLKSRSKTVTVVHDMTIYIENPKPSIKRPLQLASEFAKFARRRRHRLINIIVSLYVSKKCFGLTIKRCANNKTVLREIKIYLNAEVYCIMGEKRQCC